MGLKYTIIMHDFRKKNSLTPMEYIVCDMIYHLSVNPNAPVKDWCSMTKEHIAKEIGISKQAILNLIEKLIKAEFLEKNEVTKFLRTTIKWQSNYFTDSQESLPNNNIYINNSILDIIEQRNLAPGKETLPTVGNDNSFDSKTEFLKEFNRVKCSTQPTRILGDKAVKQLNALLKAGYTIADIGQALENAMKTKNHKESNFVYLTPEFITRADKFNIYNAANFSNITQVGVTSDSDYD